jgi:hypothetical protein
VAIPAAGSIIAAGGFEDTVTYGEQDENPQQLESEGSSDIFMLRLSAD